MTNLVRETDRAIARENARYLSPENKAQREDDVHTADHWRQQLEDEGILPSAGQPRLTCHGA